MAKMQDIELLRAWRDLILLVEEEVHLPKEEAAPTAALSTTRAAAWSLQI